MLNKFRPPHLPQTHVGRGVLFQGDCLDIMPFFESKSVNAIICDLPYGTTNCNWDSVIDLQKLWQQYKRIIKDDGVIILTGQQPFTSNLIISNQKMFKYSWVWEKSKATGFLNSKKRPLVAHEDILVFAKGSPYYNPQMSFSTPYNKGLRKVQTENDVYSKFNQTEIKSSGLRYPRSVQYFKTAESEGKMFHKSQKPLALMEYLIKTYTNENDVVMDNCMGSNTTGLACKILNRQFVGIEKDENYFKLSVERVS